MTDEPAGVSRTPWATPDTRETLSLSFVILMGVVSRLGASRVPRRDISTGHNVLGGCRRRTGLHKVAVNAERNAQAPRGHGTCVPTG